MKNIYNHLNNASKELCDWNLKPWSDIFGEISKDEILDPKNITNIGEFKTMSFKTKSKYVNIWLEFCYTYDISIEKIPLEKDFEEYFKAKFEHGNTFQTLKTLYSYLNKPCFELYGWNIEEIWPEIFKFLQGQSMQTVLLAIIITWSKWMNSVYMYF